MVISPVVSTSVSVSGARPPTLTRLTHQHLLIYLTIRKQEHQTLPLGLEPTYHTLYLPMHIHTYTCPSNPKVGKCTR